VTPLIATLGGGALATGLAYSFSGEGAPAGIPASYSQFISATTLGVPRIAYCWVVVVILAAGLLRYSALGRRFTAVGANPTASRALGFRVDAYKATAYVLGGLMYAIAGVFVAIAVTTPGLKIGDPYLLPSIAAVVIGGTRLGGGVGSIGATSLGALFVTQLNNFTLAVNGSSAIQQIVQGAVIVVAMAIFGIKIDLGSLLPRRGTSSAARRTA
jgi:ribose transport system permease protein